MVAAYDSRRDGSAGPDTQPSAVESWSGLAPAKGESLPARAAASNFSRAAAQAASTALPTLAAVCEPPETGVFGMAVSPSSKRTFSTGRPSASAATCVMTV